MKAKRDAKKNNPQWTTKKHTKKRKKKKTKLPHKTQEEKRITDGQLSVEHRDDRRARRAAGRRTEAGGEGMKKIGM